MIYQCDVWIERTGDTMRAWVHSEDQAEANPCSEFPATLEGLQRLKSDLCCDATAEGYLYIDELTIPPPGERCESVSVALFGDD